MIDFSMYEQKEPEVNAYKCPECGTLYYPAPMICHNCDARRDPSGVIFSEWEKVPFGGKCKLLTWTRVYALPEGYDIKYLLFGIVQFENGLRASGRLLADDPETGMELFGKAGVIKEKDGKDIYGFMFDMPE